MDRLAAFRYNSAEKVSQNTSPVERQSANPGKAPNSQSSPKKSTKNVQNGPESQIIREDPSSSSKFIKALPSSSIHRLTTSQVVVTLEGAVKELVENSLDAQATSIQVSFKDSGISGLTIQDNGIGITETNFETICLPHTTNKISSFEDLAKVTSFGFRGEALNALCAVSTLTILTNDGNEMGSRLEYDKKGHLKSNNPAARERGTTITLQDIFSTLPVRHMELKKNIKREFNKTITLLQSFAIVHTNLRLNVTNEVNGKISQVFSSLAGEKSMKDTISQVYGAKSVETLVPINHELSVEDEDGKSIVKLSGWISRASSGAGRSNADRTILWINKRPCNLPALSRVINEAYKKYNSTQYPVYFINLTLPPDTFDVNLSPDKRTIMLHNEKLIIDGLRIYLDDVLSGSIGSFEVNQVETPKAMVKPVSAKSTLQRFLASPKPQVETQDTPVPVIRIPLDLPSVNTPSIVDTPSRPIVDSSVQKLPIVDTPAEKRIPLVDAPILDTPGIQDTPVVNTSLIQETPILQTQSIDTPTHRVPVVSHPTDTPVERITPLATPAPKPLRKPSPPSTASNQPESQTEQPTPKRRIPQKRQAPSPSPEPVSYDWKPQNTQLRNTTSKLTYDISAIKQGLEKSREKLSTDPQVECPAIDAVDAESNLVKTVNKQDFLKMKILGQFNLGFIVAKLIHEDGYDLYIIDQHAADEKFNFETFERTVALQSQPLVHPKQLQLTPQEELIVEENMDVLRRNGFQITLDTSLPPTQRCKLLGLPTLQNTTLGEVELAELLNTLAEKMDDHAHKDSARPAKVRAYFASKACRKAVMIGDPLPKARMEKIVQNMATLHLPWNCPHGRPSMRHLLHISE